MLYWIIPQEKILTVRLALLYIFGQCLKKGEGPTVIIGLYFFVRAKFRKQRTEKNNLSGREHSFSREVLPMSDCKAILSLLFCQIEHHDVLQEKHKKFCSCIKYTTKKTKGAFRKKP